MSDNSVFDDDLDWDNVPDDPFYKPDDTYVMKIIEATKRTSQKGIRGLSITYMVVEGPHTNKRTQEWKTIPWKWEVEGYATKEEWDDKVNHSDEVAAAAQRNLSFLKARFQEFGYSAEDMNTVQPKDLLDLGLLDVTIYHDKNKNERIRGIALHEGSDSAADPLSGSFI